MTRRIAHKLETQWRSEDVLQSEDEKATFEEFLLSKQLLSGLRKAGFVRPSPIQLRAIPLGLCGFDMVVQAKSGTGKTCLFSVLTLQAVDVSKNAVQVLILAPTREIAVQSCDTVSCLGCDMPELKTYAFIGGVPIKEDLQKLARCHVAVGTLGRLLQLIQQDQLSLEWVRLLVLDEADQLLGEGFQEDLSKLWASLPERRQVIATSATYPPEVARILEEDLLRKPMVVRLGADTPSLLGVSQWYCVAEGTDEAAWFSRKLRTLDKLLRRMPFSQCLVFLNSQARAQSLEERLRHAGHKAQLLSGAQTQSDRIKALVCLKAYRCRILVSTDLAARGIDAERVNLVIHFDVAYDLETHLHRSGRAGRYGTAGQAVTLVTGLQELEKLRLLCAPLNLDIKPLPGFPSCEWKSNGLEQTADASSDVADEMTVPVVQEHPSEVVPTQEDICIETASVITGPTPHSVSKVTCAHLVATATNTAESSSASSSKETHGKEMPLAVSTVPPPSGSGSTELDVPSAQIFMSTVELAPECDDKEVHAEIEQSPASTTEVLQSQNTSPVKKSFLQPVMDAPLKLKEILMDQKVPPRVQPLLNWPPDPSFGKELAAHIREEKEAFSKAYGVVFEPGRSLKIAVAQRGSERSSVSSLRDEAIRSHNECKTEDTKPAVQLDTAADDSNIEEKQEPSDIVAEAVDVRVIVHHEKQEAEASGMLHSDGAVYEETSKGQQEANVHASVSKGTSREQVDASTCDSTLSQPKMSHPGPKECKLKERHGTAQANDTNNLPEKHADESGKPAEVMKMKHHIVSHSKHEKSSLNPKPAIRTKGRTRESHRLQPRALDTTRKTVLQEALKDSATVVRCQQKQPKGVSFGGGGSDNEDSRLHIGFIQSSTPSREPMSLTHLPRASQTCSSPLAPLCTPPGRPSDLTNAHHAVGTSLCHECAQKCDAIRERCCRERHSLRGVKSASLTPSFMTQFQVCSAGMDWSRNWFMWHQWYIKRMLQVNGYC